MSSRLSSDAGRGASPEPQEEPYPPGRGRLTAIGNLEMAPTIRSGLFILLGVIGLGTAAFRPQYRLFGLGIAVVFLFLAATALSSATRLAGIVFSGVCVGRGYVNDPERTRRAFMADPHRPGQRLYRGGDHGRWLPEGKLEFLGRRDAQVKIRGFRIEIGEIENALLRVPGVRDGAVVVAEQADQDKHLVAFYSGERPVEVDVLRDRLGASLPTYMIPSAFHWREGLPLTANSKIDRKVLATLAAELDVVDVGSEPPSTATERHLAAAWAQVLGMREDQIGRRDHFFDLGGTSLSAVKLAIALDRAVSLKDIAEHPILADMAELLHREHAHELLTSSSDRN